MKRDEGGEWTYTGAGGNSVINYVIGVERVRERLEGRGLYGVRPSTGGNKD